MTKHRVPLNQLSPGKINQWAEDGDDFESASMSGRPGNPGPWGHGQLDTDWSALLTEHASAGDVSYVIYSYSTPIAWRTSRGWVIVTQTFSVTTGARHQPRVRYIQPQREGIWCSGGGQAVKREDGVVGCPSCSLKLGERKRVVPTHLLLKGRVSA